MPDQTKPKPRRDRHRVPFCNADCPHYRIKHPHHNSIRSFHCELLGRPLNESDRFCEPAICEMAAEIEQLRQKTLLDAAERIEKMSNDSTSVHLGHDHDKTSAMLEAQEIINGLPKACSRVICSWLRQWANEADDYSNGD